MLDEDRIPNLGEIVLYIDEDGVGHPAFVAYLHPSVGRPRLNLTMIKPDGKFSPRVDVEPAEHDGIRWIKLNKWAFFDEIEKEEWEAAEYRSRQVGVRGCRAQM